MIDPVTVELLGEPVPFARTRPSATTGFPITPKRQRAATEDFKRLAAIEMMGRAPLDQPIKVAMTAVFGIPKSWSERKQTQARYGEIKPAKVPDIDNIYKLIADAANTVIWRDDSLVVEATLRKIYGDHPCVRLTVTPLPNLSER